MNFIRQTALAALTLCALGGAQALTIHHQISRDSNIAPLRSTAWSVDALLPQFDSSLGTLDSVTLTLFGHLEGSAKAESNNIGARDVTLNLGATLKLVNPVSGSTLVQTTPLVSNSFNAASFDGTADFGGTSGRSYLGLSANHSTARTFTDGVTLAMFTGTGAVTTRLSAQGASSYLSSGNIDTQFRTKASGYASVTYAYHTTAVPEPGTWALMLSGLGMIGMLASRRRA